MRPAGKDVFRRGSGHAFVARSAPANGEVSGSRVGATVPERRESHSREFRRRWDGRAFGDGGGSGTRIVGIPLDNESRIAGFVDPRILRRRRSGIDPLRVISSDCKGSAQRERSFFYTPPSTHP